MQKQMYIGNIILISLIYLFLLQNAVAQHIPMINYADEVYAFVGIFLLAYKSLVRKKIIIQKSSLQYLFCFFVFSLACILGNVIYQYQTISVAFVDFYTNFKFFGAIITSLVIFQNSNYHVDKVLVLCSVKVFAICIFILLLFDIIFHIFGCDGYRYGIRAEQLIYVLPTYLAGAMVFLLSILLIFFEKKNLKYIVLVLIVLSSTLRSKAFAATILYFIILYMVVYREKTIKLWHVVGIALIVLVFSWNMIAFYYIELNGSSARSLLTITSLKVAIDYFPIGSGFGTYASHEAGVNYSPVYLIYGLNNYWELSNLNSHAFIDDTFWPIIIGQSGVLGSIAYICLQIKLFISNIKVRKINKHMYAMVLFVFFYLLISSTSEPTFNNAIAIPMAMLIGYSWAFLKRQESFSVHAMHMGMEKFGKDKRQNDKFN